jgi:hypothetical protein
MKHALVALLLIVTPAAAQQQINHSHDADWKRLIDNAKRLNWKLSKDCYPNDGQNNIPYCTYALTSPLQNDKQIALREHYNSNNVLFARTVCHFNNAVFVRDCWNIETSNQVREMLNTSTNVWHVIE